MVPGGAEGLIPAHAGKMVRVSQVFAQPWAHPRSRGENGNRHTNPVTETGSSPLTRGKCRRNRIRRAHAGLIPAHAGKMAIMGAARAPPAAHPRSRGENEGHPRMPRWPRGSSPLTRGKW